MTAPGTLAIRSAASRRAARTKRLAADHMMTPRMKVLFVFIYSYTREHDYAPKQAEMQAALGHSSNGYITALLDELEVRGLIERTRRKARGVVVVDRDLAAMLMPPAPTDLVAA